LHEHEAEEVARDQAEGVRLAYVAATRARDLLVVPTLGDEPWEGGWFSPLNRALYPESASRRTATRGPKCPGFKSKDSVMRRPDDEMAGPTTVCPGQHVFDAGYSVVWWDPNALALEHPPLSGVKRADLIVKDVAKHVVADGRGRYDRWKLARLDARAAGSKPSITALTVREWTLDDTRKLPSSAGDIDVAIETRGFDPGSAESRSGGIAFGVLVHAILAQIDLDADHEAIADVARNEARVLGLNDADVASATHKVVEILKHPLLKQARAAAVRGACRRETPVTYRLPDGTIVEGVVDLAFEEQGRWTIVDYKTDRELATTSEEHYRKQVALYAAAIAEATGRGARGVLLRV